MISSKSNLLEKSPCRADVASDLFFQSVERRESLLLAELLDEDQLDFLSVQVAREIEQVGLDARLRFGRTESWAHANIDDRWTQSSTDLSMRGINAVRR